MEICFIHLLASQYNFFRLLFKKIFHDILEGVFMFIDGIYEDLKYFNFNEFKHYIFAFLTYKYISERIESLLNKELINDDITFEEAYENDEYKEYLKEDAIERIGFFLEPKYLFRNVLKETERHYIPDNLYYALYNLKIECLVDELHLFEIKKFSYMKKIDYYEDPQYTVPELLFRIYDWTNESSINEVFDFFLKWYSEIGSSCKNEDFEELSEFTNICSNISKILDSEGKNIKMLENNTRMANEILCEIYVNMENYDFHEELTVLVKRIILMYVIINFI